MNERIRELYITAMREDCGEKWDTQEEFIARFAELIVRECGYYADRFKSLECSEYMDPLEKPSEYIKRQLEFKITYK